MFGLENMLLAGMTLFIVGLSTYLFMSRRSLSRSFDRIRFLESRVRSLNAGLLDATREKSQAIVTAEQLPVIVQKLADRLPAESHPPIIVRYAKEILEASRVGYFVPVPNSEHYTLQVGCGFPRNWQGKVRIAQDEGALGQALRQRIVLARKDVEHGGLRSSYPSLEREGIEPDLVAPVDGIAGVEGVLVVAGCSRSPTQMKAHVSMLADLLSLSIRNARLLESREQGVCYDHLTGLANRFHFASVFETEIRRTRNYQQPLSLLFFDLDRFKEVNDTWGHFAGDSVLRSVAQVVRRCTRSSHLVARYGGDEFVVLLPSTNKEQACQYAENLRQRIAETEFRVEGRDEPARLTISGGLAMFPGDGLSTTDLVRAADDALYEAKKGGRNRIVQAGRNLLSEDLPVPPTRAATLIAVPAAATATTTPRESETVEEPARNGASERLA